MPQWAQDTAITAGLAPGGAKSFAYESDFDENGVLFFLGSQGGSQRWTNPAEAGRGDR